MVAVKAPGFGERKTSYLEDIAILTGGTMVKEELGVTLEKATEDVLGVAAKVVVTKEACTIVGDGRTQREVAARVKQIQNLVANTDQDYEREKLNERIARLSGGVAIIQVCGRVESVAGKEPSKGWWRWGREADPEPGGQHWSGL